MISNTRLGNLHIHLEGEFDIATVKKVARCISNTWNGSGNVFIHTQKVTEIQPDSRQIFETMVGLYDLSKENIFFVGEPGRKLCREHDRVFISSSKKMYQGGSRRHRNRISGRA